MAHNFEELVIQAEEYRAACNSWLPMGVPETGGEVDEVSILFHSAESMGKFKVWTDGAVGRPEFYHQDAQVMYTINDRGAKEYAYHVNFHFFNMDGGAWRIQTQAQFLVNPLRPCVNPLFEGAGDGEVVHLSWKPTVPLPTVADKLQTFAPWLVHMESEHGYSLYNSTKPGEFPYLHPRSPKP